MNKPGAIDTSAASLAVSVDAETARLLSAVAQARGQSPEAFAAEAVRRVVESEADFDAFIQVGIDAIERGDVIPHEQVMAELDQMIAAHRARCE